MENEKREFIIKKLKEKGFRITRQRRMLLDVILANECSSCKEIFFEASRSVFCKQVVLKKKSHSACGKSKRNMRYFGKINAVYSHSRLGKSNSTSSPTPTTRIMVLY